mgnify:FL=1|jgi:hypothetical protein
MSKETEDFLRHRAQAYTKVFSGIPAETVLEDLAKFCRANESTFHENARIEGIMQGRREVWLRISQHMNLSPEEMLQLYNPTEG